MNTDFALIDAAFGRAFEGLRILDEMARFIFNDTGLFVFIKKQRHELVVIQEMFGSAKLLTARQGVDSGAVHATSDLHARFSSWGLIRANAARASQALRELEEFAALYAPSAVLQLATRRYTVYQIEQKLAQCTPHYYLRKYFEEGVVYCISESPEELCALIEKGATVVQLRDKKSDEKIVFEKAKFLCAYVATRNKERPDNKVIFIINDFVRIASELPVGGIHVGQDVEDVLAVRQIIGSNKIIGRSNQSVEAMRDSLKFGADYVSIGPVFSTPTKPDRLAVGIATVREAAHTIFSPWVAIGGLNTHTAKAVYEAGGKNIAVVRSAREFFV